LRSPKFAAEFRNRLVDELLKECGVGLLIGA